MKIHILQHVPFENSAEIGAWASSKKHSVSETHFYRNPELPLVKDFDFLLVLGGPMNIYEDKKYPWLSSEKKLIEKAIKNEKLVLGVCLGAQLIADVLGGRVTKNAHKEIGWFPVMLTHDSKKSSIFKNLPHKINAFHWHGDTFEIPKGALHIAQNEACTNQAFEYQRRVVGFQFHIESNRKSIENLIQNCPEDLVAGKYVQPNDNLLSGGNFAEIHSVLHQFLNQMEEISLQLAQK